MRTKTIKIYKYSELSDKAKEKALEDKRGNQEYHHADENEASMRKFESIFPINVKDYQYGGVQKWITHEFTEEESIGELYGIRLLAYLQNNYHREIFKGKYYSLWSKKDQNPHYTEKGHAPWGKLKSRHSKIMLGHDGCPFTGYYTDFSILKPIYDFIDKPDNTTFKELMGECLDNWIADCEKDYEYTYEDEYLEEEIEANDYEFLETGELY